jgi:hypothetical protein
MSKAKKLSSGIILSTRDKQFVKKQVIIRVDGKDYEVLVDQKFEVKKIQQLLMELAEKQKQLIDINQVMEIPNYVQFLIIKYFCDIDFAKVEDFDQQLRVYSAMLDLDIVDTIIGSFDEEELKKINIYMKRLSANLDKLNTQLDENPEFRNEFNTTFTDINSYIESKAAELINEDIVAEATEITE